MTERGSTLVVVLWALVALSALSLTASIGAVVDLRLSVRHREHGAALASAEAGIAEGLAALTTDSARGLAADSVAGAEDGSPWVVRWTPVPGGVGLRATGRSGAAIRELVAFAAPDASGIWTVGAWREVR